MADCNNPECKAEFRSALHELGTNLYGDGPEGIGGVYGDLKKKVSYSIFWVLMTFLSGYIGSSVTFAIMHENRLSRVETIVDVNRESVTKVSKQVEDSHVLRDKQFAEILMQLQRIKQ